MIHDYWGPPGGRSPILGDFEHESVGDYALTYIEKAEVKLKVFTWEELQRNGLLVELGGNNPQRLHSFSFPMHETRGHYLLVIDAIPHSSHDFVDVCAFILHFYTADTDIVPELNLKIATTRAEDYWNKYQ